MYMQKLEKNWQKEKHRATSAKIHLRMNRWNQKNLIEFWIILQSNFSITLKNTKNIHMLSKFEQILPTKELTAMFSKNYLRIKITSFYQITV